MTAVVRAADAPRDASSMNSNSARCSCTGGDNGCIRKTSLSRQLAFSCTYKQSLPKCRIVLLLRGTCKESQTSFASSTWAVPLKIVISRMGLYLSWTLGPYSDCPANVGAINRATTAVG